MQLNLVSHSCASFTPPTNHDASAKFNHRHETVPHDLFPLTPTRSLKDQSSETIKSGTKLVESENM